jgi:formylmethanofuran:tetrahydromethanopterin formyltransferase
VGILAATEVKGIKKVTAVNFGGILGPFRIENRDAIEVVSKL